MREFQVSAERSNQWWVLVCDEVGAVGQCRRLDQVDETMREAIAYQSGLDQGAFAIYVTPVLPEEFTRLRQDADDLRTQAAASNHQAAERARQAARLLASQGLALRDIGQLMGVSAQRAHQLLAA